MNTTIKSRMTDLRIAVLMLASMTVLTGVIYPLTVTGIGQALFPRQANGNLIVENGRVRGSTLIGQEFSGHGYFHGRPSATAPVPYNAAASAGSNQGPTNEALRTAVSERARLLREANPDSTAPIPVDLVTASASGLDPDISVASAIWQVPGIAKARGLTQAGVRNVVDAATADRQFFVLGEPRVNVLKANLMLDSITAGGNHDR